MVVLTIKFKKITGSFATPRLCIIDPNYVERKKGNEFWRHHYHNYPPSRGFSTGMRTLSYFLFLATPIPTIWERLRRRLNLPNTCDQPEWCAFIEPAYLTSKWSEWVSFFLSLPCLDQVSDKQSGCWLMNYCCFFPLPNLQFLVSGFSDRTSASVCMVMQRIWRCTVRHYPFQINGQ